MNEVTAQQRASDAVVRPSGSFMTAAETLNWIAFQQAVNADLTGRSALWQEFGYEPVFPPQVGGWDYVVAEAANMLQPEHQALMHQWQNMLGREPRNLQAARDNATRYRTARGWSAVELHLYSTARRDICAQRLGKLTQAQHGLIDGLAAERLTAWAMKVTGSGPDSEVQPVGVASAVPWHLFLTHGVMVQPSGSIGVNGEPLYLHTRFRAAEVVTLWPAIEAQPPMPGALKSSVSTDDKAVAWMQSHVTERGKWKLESAIEQCRADTGSTYRAARAAWKRLPEDLRGRPGAHK